MMPIEHIKAARMRRELKKGKVCVYCNSNNPIILTIDHIQPKIRGGKEDKSNFQVACRICNFLKGPLTHEEFKEYFTALKILYALCKVQLKVELGLAPKLDFYPLSESDVANHQKKETK